MSTSESTLQRKYVSGGKEVAAYLTTMSASGYLLDRIHVGVINTTLTLTKTRSPAYFFYTFISTKYLYQPQGWDFVYADRQGAYFRVLLPASPEIRRAQLVSGDVEEETRWLENIAAIEGKMLFTADGMSYTLIPMAMEDKDPPLRYRVVTFEDIVEGDDHSDLLLKLPDTTPYKPVSEGEGTATEESDSDPDPWYFICVSSGSVTAAYYASSPCILPPAEGKSMTVEDYRKAHLQERLSPKSFLWVLFGLFLLLTNQGDSPQMRQGWLMIVLYAVIVSAIYVLCRSIIHGNLKKLLRQCEEQGSTIPIPTSPRNIRIRGIFKRIITLPEPVFKDSSKIPAPTEAEAARPAAEMPMPEPLSHAYGGNYGEFAVPPPKEQPLGLHLKTMKRQQRFNLGAIFICVILGTFSLINAIALFLTTPIDWLYGLIFSLSTLTFGVITVLMICESMRTGKRIREMKQHLRKEKES